MPSSQAVSRHSGSPKKWRISTAEKRGENEIQNCTGNKISMHWISTQALPDGDVVCDERRQIRTYVQVCHYTVNVRQHWCARLTNWASCRVDHSDWLRRQFFQLRTCNIWEAHTNLNRTVLYGHRLFLYIQLATSLKQKFSPALQFQIPRHSFLYVSTLFPPSSEYSTVPFSFRRESQSEPPRR